MRFAILITALVLASCQSESSQDSKHADTHDSHAASAVSFSDYISQEDTLEILGEGYNWSEGPIWVPNGGFLLFSDVPENKVYKWAEGEGVSIYLDPSGYTGDEGSREGANGLLIDPDGRLLLCQHGDRRVARMGASTDKPASAFETVADRYDVKRFNSPNDLCMDSKGNLYFTDPPYGLPKGEADPERELDYQGVYKVDPEGQVHLLVDNLTRPNGIALSPDENILYVANSDPKKAVWMAYDLDDKQEIAGERLLLDKTDLVGEDNPGLPDGLKVHKDGTLFATGPGGVLLISPEGEHLGTIRTGQATANCAFGPGQKHIYMTADMYLMRLALRK
ncbi:MAG: SMP-30/gluconolactonase/LRE family protein [Bacteroidota bacterium]